MNLKKIAEGIESIIEKKYDDEVEEKNELIEDVKKEEKYEYIEECLDEKLDDGSDTEFVSRAIITESKKYDGKIIGKNARLQYSRGYFKLEELHQKGKRKLRVAELSITPFLQTEGPLLMVNILSRARISQSDTYDQMKNKIKAQVEKGYDELVKNSQKWAEYAKKNEKWFGKENWYEKLESSLKVEPEGVDPIKAHGKDFVLDSEWGSFLVYSPSSDFQSGDPHYSSIYQKSNGAARKLYKILKSNPDALKNVSYSDLGKWLDKKKIGYKYGYSVWH